MTFPPRPGKGIPHTPGPWKVVEDPCKKGDKHYFSIEAGCGYFDITTESGFDFTGIMSHHDALLIAAAPEMLRVLKLAKKDKNLCKSCRVAIEAILDQVEVKH